MITGHGLGAGGLGVGGFAAGQEGTVPINTPVFTTAVDYDATGDYQQLSADLSGIADSDKFIFVCRLRIDGGDGATRTIFRNWTRFFIRLNTSNQIRVFGQTAAASTLLDIRSEAHAAGGGVLWLAASADLGTSGARSVIVNGTDETTQTTFTSGDIDNTVGRWIQAGNGAGGELFDGAEEFIYYNAGEYMDFTRQENLRKFFTPEGRPVWIGNNGELPTGARPNAFAYNGDLSDNKGDGGDFTINGNPTRIYL